MIARFIGDPVGYVYDENTVGTVYMHLAGMWVDAYAGPERGNVRINVQQAYVIENVSQKAPA